MRAGHVARPGLRTGLSSALEAAQRALLDASSDHLRLCDAETPDRTALSSARWRVAQTGRARMTVLLDTVLPALEAAASDDERQSLCRFRADTDIYRAGISDYVKLWPIERIVDNWADYRRAALDFRRAIVTRLEVETALLRPLIDRVERRR